MINSSANYIGVDLRFRRLGVNFKYYRLDRDYNAIYPEDINNNILTKFYNSKLNAYHIGLDYKILNVQKTKLYIQSALMPTGYIYSTDHQYYNTVSKQTLFVPASNSRDFGDEFTVFGSLGVAADYNLYKNILSITGEIHYAKQFFENQIENGANRVVFTIGLSCELTALDR